MKPTISNAFNAGVVRSGAGIGKGDTFARGARAGGGSGHQSAIKTVLSSMQADLRPSDFGWSLELNPIQALDAAAALQRWTADTANVQFLVTLEQSLWEHSGRALSLAEIAAKLGIPAVTHVGDNELVLDASGLSELVQTCQTIRLLVVAVEGAIEVRDAQAMSRAIDRGASPLTTEMRALAAIEVLGDRSLVLHCRERGLALMIVAANFRHYLAALRNSPPERFAAPEVDQIERLFDMTGALTVRPIETEMNESAVDVTVNTSLDRFTQPGAHALTYDIPSNTWHDERR